MLCFDKDHRIHTLESREMVQWKLDLSNADYSQAVAGIGVERTQILSDGESFFLLPKESLKTSKLSEIPQAELEEIQSFFFSQEAVQAALSVNSDLLKSQDKGSLTYGTTGAKSIYEALRRVGASTDDSFLDIGCGCGLPVLIASKLVGQARGVDIVPSMVEFGQKAATRFGRENTEFLLANIRHLELGRVDIVYVAATTLTEELRETIKEKLSQLRPGAVVITLTYSFQSDALVLVDTFKSPFAWWGSSEPSVHDFLIHIRRAS